MVLSRIFQGLEKVRKYWAQERMIACHLSQKIDTVYERFYFSSEITTFFIFINVNKMNFLRTERIMKRSNKNEPTPRLTGSLSDKQLSVESSFFALNLSQNKEHFQFGLFHAFHPDNTTASGRPAYCPFLTCISTRCTSLSYLIMETHTNLSEFPVSP